MTLIAANVEVAAAAERRRSSGSRSTADLRAALLRATHGADGAAGFDALVMAAAVADFRPVDAADDEARRAATA